MILNGLHIGKGKKGHITTLIGKVSFINRPLFRQWCYLSLRSTLREAGWGRSLAEKMRLSNKNKLLAWNSIYMLWMNLESSTYHQASWISNKSQKVCTSLFSFSQSWCFSIARNQWTHHYSLLLVTSKYPLWQEIATILWLAVKGHYSSGNLSAVRLARPLTMSHQIVPFQIKKWTKALVRKALSLLIKFSSLIKIFFYHYQYIFIYSYQYVLNAGDILFFSSLGKLFTI